MELLCVDAGGDSSMRKGSVSHPNAQDNRPNPIRTQPPAVRFWRRGGGGSKPSPPPCIHKYVLMLLFLGLDKPNFLPYVSDHEIATITIFSQIRPNIVHEHE